MIYYINAHFEDNIAWYVDFIYPEELEFKDTTDSSTSASYLDILLGIDRDQHLTTQIYDKRDDFDFSIVNFPFLCSNIPGYITGYHDFLTRAKVLTSKLFRQGYQSENLRSAFKKFYGSHHDLIEKYHLSMSKVINDILT